MRLARRTAQRRSPAKQATRVREFMTPVIGTITPHTPLEEAAELFAAKTLLGAVVVDCSGRLQGTPTEADLIRHIRGGFRELPRFHHIAWRGHALRRLQSVERRQPDLAPRIRTNLQSTGTEELLEPSRPTARPDDAFDDIAAQRFDRKIMIVPVVDANQVVGIIGYDTAVRTICQALGESRSG